MIKFLAIFSLFFKKTILVGFNFPCSSIQLFDIYVGKYSYSILGYFAASLCHKQTPVKIKNYMVLDLARFLYISFPGLASSKHEGLVNSKQLNKARI